MKLRPSPAAILALIALLAALGGTAFATGAFTAKQRKQVTKIAKGVFQKSIAGASVNHAASAGSAETAKRAEAAGRAEVATKALEAEVAAKAREASRAVEAATAQKAGEASTAESAKRAERATRADRATRAEQATRAERATTAEDADALGGVPAAQYQRRVNGSCPLSGIGAIAQDGTVACTSAVQAIHLQPLDGQEQAVDLANGLRLHADCKTNRLKFENRGPEAGNLNFLFLRSASVSAANGERLQPGGFHTVSLSPRLEGQYTWLGSQGVTTINIHTFDGAGFCEVLGTALVGTG